MADVWTAINKGSTTMAVNETDGVDVDVSGSKTLAIFGGLGNATTPATAAGDCLIGLSVYADDTNNLIPGSEWLANDLSVANGQLVNNVSSLGKRYDVSAYNKVRVYIKNTNATTALQGGILIVAIDSR